MVLGKEAEGEGTHKVGHSDEQELTLVLLVLV
jgi:hypothetical protein